ncbi:hypothetical protein ABZP36_001120 [Zizania latifolia]
MPPQCLKEPATCPSAPGSLGWLPAGSSPSTLPRSSASASPIWNTLHSPTLENTHQQQAILAWIQEEVVDRDEAFCRLAV